MRRRSAKEILLLAGCACVVLVGCGARTSKPVIGDPLEAERIASKNYLDSIAKRSGMERAQSGALLDVLEPGSGDAAVAGGTVTFRYTTKLRDGETIYDSDVLVTPPTVSLNQVSSCLRDALTRLAPGGRARAYCPADLVYGDEPPMGVNPYAAIIADIELIAVGLPLPPHGH